MRHFSWAMGWLFFLAAVWTALSAAWATDLPESDKWFASTVILLGASFVCAMLTLNREE